MVTAEAAATAVVRVAAAATAAADDIAPTQREPAPTMDVDDNSMKELKDIPKEAMNGLTKVSLTFEREARRLAKSNKILTTAESQLKTMEDDIEKSDFLQASDHSHMIKQ